MLTDYKISKLTRYDDGRMEVVSRFYEGEITTEDELNNVTREMESVTRYRRTAMIREETIVYSQAITDSVLKERLDDMLAEDSTRTPIPEQTRG
jgi:hypothetical protein